ncbi:MAG: hypothetical protein K1X75_04465 [Leptospirales bacterium]|nr:hypothetical protein [Leptospirales bacterium]
MDQPLSVWLPYIAAIAPAALLLAAASVWLRLWLRGQRSARASIDQLRPAFAGPSRLRTDWLELEYSFDSGRGCKFRGSALAPLEYFLGQSELNLAVLWLDPRVDLPVLAHGDERYVGEEAIEHYLLGRRSEIEIRYVARRPERNAPAGLERAFKKVVDKRPSNP